MNRQTTYFLQRVLSGVTTSVIYALFDNYRYNQSKHRYQRQPKTFNNTKKYYARPKASEKDKEPSYYQPEYRRQNRYK